MSLDDARAARRLASDRGAFVPTAEDNLRIAAENREHDRRSIAAGAAAAPLSTWQQVADYVDEPTWLRILADLSPTNRAECERIRPPKGLHS